MDFRITKIQNLNLTKSTTLLSLPYAVPEQITHQKFNNLIDQRTDIYALGLIFYETIFCEPFFKGDAYDILFQKFDKLESYINV
ncbi:MAG: hypothetical protein ACPLW7_00045 [Minisyncoccia bacterium]